MTEDESNPNQSGLPEEGGLLRDALAGAGPRSDLTYRTIANASLTGRSLHQSLLTGSILRESVFCEVDFSRCDLDGVRIERCQFVRCDFTNVDLRSAAIGNTTFDSCDFKSAYWVDTSLRDVGLVNCSFRNAVVTSCTFSGGGLERTDLAESSFTHNRFLGTRFESITLGDCTFLYAVMRACTFAHTNLNAESIGMIFGLTIEDLEGLGIVYLGRAQASPPSGELADALLKVYAQRRWLLGVCLIAINFRRTSNAVALRAYVEAMVMDVRSGRPLRRDELNFFATVIEELSLDHDLPLMSCIDVVEQLSQLGDHLGTEHDETQRVFIRGILSRLYFLLQRMLGEFEEARLEIGQDVVDETVRLTAVFEAAPQLALAEVLTELGKVSGLPCTHRSEKIEARQGSYIECVKTTLLTLVAFQLFLYLAKGCVIQMVELRAHVSVLRRPRLPRTLIEQALKPRQALPPFLAAPLQKIHAHAAGLPWLGDPTLRDLAPPNLMSMTIETEPERVPRTSI